MVQTSRRESDAESAGRSGRRAGRSETPIQDALDRHVLDSVRPVCGALALLYVVFAVAHRFLLPASVSTPLVITATSSAVVLAGLWAVVGRWDPPARSAHLLGALVAGVVLANSLLHLHLTAEPRQTTNLLLLVLGVGVVFLDVGWFALVVTATFVGWIWTFSGVAADGAWIHYGFALVASTALAAAVLVARIRIFRRIDELRSQDRVSRLELEAALERTESARRGERDAREAVEHAARELRESEERFRRLADASYEGVVVQQDGRIVDANARAARLFGRRPGSLVGRSVEELVPDEDGPRVTGFLDGVVEPDREAIQTEGLRPDGSRFALKIRRASATHKGREASVGVLRDVTEQVEIEAMLRRAAAEAKASSRAKSTFLANMSHELRTPLNSVIGFANILRKNSAENLSEKELGYVDRIVSNGKLLLEIIGDVLDLSKIEAGRMEPTSERVELPELVREAVRTVELEAERKGLVLEAEIPPEVAPLQADPHRLQQILLNLLSNAVKFTDEGRVTVRVLTESDSNRPLRVEVEDTGPGIPDDRLADIFEAFRQAEDSTARRYGGTGLGLTICRSLAELMGYAMEVESEVGEGTTFSILFEPDAASSRSAPDRVSKGAPDPAGEPPGEQGGPGRAS